MITLIGRNWCTVFVREQFLETDNHIKMFITENFKFCNLNLELGYLIN